MAQEAKLEILLDSLKFAEGPRWRDGKLWFSDFYTHRVMTVDLKGKAETVVEVAQQPSGLGWTPDGKLLVVSMLDHRLLEIDGTRRRVVADLSAFVTGPCNDMVVDAKGRAYVGNFGFDLNKGEAPRSTCIVRVDPDGKAVRAADELMFPNGTVITPDGKTLIIGETFAARLTAFDVAPDGALSNRRLFAALDGCFPDGICLDAEGAVWVTNPRGPEVLRVFEGGRIAERVSTGDRFAFACMLGGADRRTLFVLTNTGSGPAAAAKTDGRVETVRVAVPGAGLP
jgi:sugar lactone lactonase YvrE